jgi:hypothetical protein
VILISFCQFLSLSEANSTSLHEIFPMLYQIINVLENIKNNGNQMAVVRIQALMNRFMKTHEWDEIVVSYLLIQKGLSFFQLLPDEQDVK